MKKCVAIIFIILIFIGVYLTFKKDNVVHTEGVLVKNFKRSIDYGCI